MAWLKRVIVVACVIAAIPGIAIKLRDRPQEVLTETLGWLAAVVLIVGLCVSWVFLSTRFQAFSLSNRIRPWRVVILLGCIVASLYLMAAFVLPLRFPPALIPVFMVGALLAGWGAAQTICSIAGWLASRGGRAPESEPTEFPSGWTVQCAGCGREYRGIRWPWNAEEFSEHGMEAIGYFCSQCGVLFCETCKHDHLGWSWWSGFEHAKCGKCGSKFPLADCLAGPAGG